MDSGTIINALLIGGIISIIISISDVNSTYMGSIIGYTTMFIVCIFIIYGIFQSENSTSIARSVAYSMPFILIASAVFMLIYIISTNQTKINNYSISTEYYDKSSYAFITLVIIIILYKYNSQSLTDFSILGIITFFGLCFLGYVIIINDILKYSSTDDPNMYFMNS